MLLGQDGRISMFYTLSKCSQSHLSCRGNNIVAMGRCLLEIETTTCLFANLFSDNILIPIDTNVLSFASTVILYLLLKRSHFYLGN